jgi:hypothetical protein
VPDVVVIIEDVVVPTSVPTPTSTERVVMPTAQGDHSRSGPDYVQVAVLPACGGLLLIGGALAAVRVKASRRRKHEQLNRLEHEEMFWAPPNPLANRLGFHREHRTSLHMDIRDLYPDVAI